MDKITPFAIISLFFLNNKNTIPMFSKAPNVINFPKFPCAFKLVKPSVKLIGVNNVINRKQPINEVTSPIKTPINKSFFSIICSSYLIEKLHDEPLNQIEQEL